MANRQPLTDGELLAFAEASNSEYVSEEENHTSDESETENSDNEDDILNEPVATTSYVLSKNGHIKWELHPPQHHTGRLSKANVIKKTFGVTRYATERINDMESAFNVIFSSIENVIIKFTNIEGQRVYGEKWKNLDNVTFQAYVGLLLLAGVYKSHGEATKSLWDSETGRNIFRATMSLETFCKISRVIRFDDKSTRSERRCTDKLAAVREIWEKWVEVLPKLYNPFENVTVDEQLVAFRGRCPFKQYIPSKPAKYGVKIWTLCDTKTSYVLKSQVYTGKEPGAKPEKNQGMRVVADLTRELSGHNVTCDNFFTSYSLAQLMLKRKLTLLGTMRKNKAELPRQITNKQVYSSSFYFTENTVVMNYVPKKNKNVILLSTLHNDKKVSDRPDKKPNIILDYNATKGAVDTLDQLVNTYTCRRKTNRWPLIIFYNIIDISAYNAFVLWTSMNPNWNNKKLSKRRIFLDELGKALIKPHISSRQYMPRTVESCNIVKNIQSPTHDPQPKTSAGSVREVKRARCKFCPSKNDNKTNMACSKCNKHVCKFHVAYYCPNCAKQ